MFLTHADDTHDSFFPKVFPIIEAETETYPDLSNLVGKNFSNNLPETLIWWCGECLIS